MTVAANWSTIEDAIQAQIVAASGLSGSKVIWEHQGRDRPTTELITLRLDGAEDTAPATPENRVTDNPAPTAGAEILLTSSQQVDFDLVVTLYAGPKTGTGSAFARLNKVRAYLGRDDVVETLGASGLALFAVGRVRSQPTILETEFESRATLTLRFRTVDGNEETTTYIETAEVTGSYS